MDSGNNSSSLQSSSGGGGGGNGDEEFDSRAFFATSNPTNTNINNFPGSISDNINIITSGMTSNPLSIHLPFFDNLSYLDPPLLSSSLAPRGAPPPDTHPPAPASARTPASLATASRNPKKRSRASRRAPTTVLTTDTANFRAMVQEFTGIPAPPFASSSSSSRSRFDFFNPAAINSPPSFLLKPYPQKFQFPNSNNDGIGSSSLFNYQLPSSSASLGPGPGHHGQGPALDFHPLLQSRTSAMAPSTSSAGDYGGLPGLIGPGWGQQDAGGDPTQLRPPAAGTTSYGMSMMMMGSKANNGSSCKLNYSAPGPSTADFNIAEKGPAEGRGEGMVESWICSSD